MKKVFILILFLAGSGFIQLHATNPIPSYNVPVYHVANFQETNRGLTKGPFTRGERSVVVRVTGLSSNNATIWVYSLDNQDIYGPYTIYGGETYYVPIDEREWGVLVTSDDHVTVDVWIEEETRGGTIRYISGQYNKLPIRIYNSMSENDIKIPAFLGIIKQDDIS